MSIRARLANWHGRHRVELRQSLRATVAALLAYVVGELLGLPQSYWAVLTAVIVMQASVGASLKAAFDRMAGTVGGAVWGIAVALALPHQTPLALGLALDAALAPLALVAAFHAAYRIAPVTAIIVLTSALTQPAGVLQPAINRVLEIGLGGLMALGVSLLVLPARAHHLLAEAADTILRQMGTYAETVLSDIARGADAGALRAHQADIRSAITRAETLADEAARERSHRLTDAPDCEPLLRTLRRVRYDLVMIGRATAAPAPAALLARLAPAARALGDALALWFRTTGPALAAAAAPPSLAPVRDALDAYGSAVAALRHEGAIRPLSDEVAARFFGLAFAVEELRRDLTDLAERGGELARPDGPPLGSAGRPQRP